MGVIDSAANGTTEGGEGTWQKKGGVFENPKILKPSGGRRKRGEKHTVHKQLNGEEGERPLHNRER